MLPLITKNTDNAIYKYDTQCGRYGGVGTSATGASTATLCCKFYGF